MSLSQTNEQAFEYLIEKALVGSTVRSYLSYLKALGRVNVRFEDNLLLWERV